MALLNEHSTKFTHDTDTFPISNICLHRIGQIDRNVFIFLIKFSLTIFIFHLSNLLILPFTLLIKILIIIFYLQCIFS